MTQYEQMILCKHRSSQFLFQIFIIGGFSALILLCLHFTGQLLQLHRGQGKDIYWRDSYLCPTEEEYREMVRQSEQCSVCVRVGIFTF